VSPTASAASRTCASGPQPAAGGDSRRAPRSAGFDEQELLARPAPADDRQAVAALEAGRGIELEGAEKGRRAESPGRAQWVVRTELEAAVGDQRGRIGLGGDVVELGERARAGRLASRNGSVVGLAWVG